MVTIDDLNPNSLRLPDSTDDPDVLSLEKAGSLLETLSSEMRRTILIEISEEPTTPAQLADRVDTSVQNVTYHLRKLREAGLITVVGTHYSEKGLKMDVYAPASPAIIIDVGGEEDAGTTEAERATTPVP